MAADNRDWYRDWWRKKTGYVERARFRMSEHDYQRQQRAAAWRKNFAVLAVVLFAILLGLWMRK
ncbi:MAG: hypothetical protein PHI55_13865 [Burkholderiaceae bacterium]|nr:hypothetical protein [Burkholderiaceae bacterium]